MLVGGNSDKNNEIGSLWHHKSNQIKPNQKTKLKTENSKIKSNQIKSKQTKSNQSKSNQIKSNQFNFSYYQVSTTLETGGPLGIPGYLHYNVH